MDWGQPQNFIWFWTPGAALFCFYLRSFRKRAQMSRLGERALVERLSSSLDARARFAKRALLLGALAFMVLALCQPHLRKKEITVERKGIDVMIVTDVSQSMLARDIPPNRLEKAKLELSALIDRLKGDRIGVVAFSGEAYIQCPLTLDKGAAKIFLSTIGPDLIPTPGTAVTKAIDVALQAFADKDKEHKAIVLLTDGEDHEADPRQAAKRAKEAGVRIFTVGIGTPDGSTLPNEYGQEGFKKDRSGQVVLSKLNEDLLKDVARITGGRYFRATRGELEVESLARDIRQMTQKGFKKEKIYEYEENYQYLLVLALLLFFAEAVISERKRESAA